MIFIPCKDCVSRREFMNGCNVPLHAMLERASVLA